MNISKRIIRIINFQSFISDLFFHICLFTFAFLLLTSCETTEPPPSNQKLTLTAEDASCTEAWLNLKTENISLPTEISIKQNDSTIVTANINNSDTTLFIENLLPNQTYSFKASHHGGQASNKISVTTMDTTSHDFTWETFTFGGGSSSHLSDVAIINENNIWAVGEIHTEDTDKFDSNGVWVQPYNAVHWDGNEWGLKRILVNYRGNMIFLSLEGIFAFSATDIWLVSSLPIHGDGKNWKIYDVREITNSDLSLTKAWGINSNDIYFVGRAGSIAHYNGSSWIKIDGGTKKNIYDIHGDFNPKTNNYEILSVASNRIENIKELDVLKIEGYTAEIINSSPIAQPLLSVWFKANRKYYLVGSGIYTKNNLSEEEWNGYPREISDYMTNSITAQNTNDLIITGDFNEVLHYNGVSWKSYRGDELPDLFGRLLNADYKNNLVCIVGQNENRGIIYIGRK